MNTGEPATTPIDPKETEIGSVFVSNYPPYSFWSADQVGAVEQVLDAPPRPAVPLGLYLHIPFCRKRCKFCYFKVYTEKNSVEVRRYLAALAREVELYAGRPAIAGRAVKFVYFGGGTPSFISADQLRSLVARLKAALSWDQAEEVTFECEPGTLTRPKLQVIREIGVTRLSLGVESFDDAILEENGRAHASREIYRVAPWIRELQFDQLNIDLIAGMVGETSDTWQESVRKTIDMGPDSVTIYQMELPYNTVYSQQVLDGSIRVPVADWATKRGWQEQAFERLEAAGYELSSAYTMVRRGRGSSFVYRDSLWRGSDLAGCGVSSFSHLGGVHFQNQSSWDGYMGSVEAGRLPIERAFVPSRLERLTRELILQLKLGRIEPAYFHEKFAVDVLQEFAPAFERLADRRMLEIEGGRVSVTRQGLLRVDSLLPEFYAPRYRGARYT